MRLARLTDDPASSREDNQAGFTRVPSGFILIAVMQHELHPVGVAWDQGQGVDVPDKLGAKPGIASEAAGGRVPEYRSRNSWLDPRPA